MLMKRLLAGYETESKHGGIGMAVGGKGVFKEVDEGAVGLLVRGY